MSLLPSDPSTTHQAPVPGARSAPRRVTVINDNPEFLEVMREILTAEQYDVTVINGERLASIEPVRHSQPDLLFIDLRLRQDRITGWDIARQVRRDPQLAHLPLVLCTAAVDELRDRAEWLAELPGVEVLTKPFALDELEALLARLLDPSDVRRVAPPPG